MLQKSRSNLTGVSETLLMPLYARARESQRPDGLITDERAVAMVEHLDFDFTHLRMQRHDEVAIILRMCNIDQQTRDFLASRPDGVVVHIGCGLDTRFERVDNGRVDWFDLDLPMVIELRNKMIQVDCPRYHLLNGSILQDGWLEVLETYHRCPFLFLAEGVFPYFTEDQVRALVIKLRDCFPGSELVFDAQTPFAIWANNLQLAVAGLEARLHWGLKHGKDLETWGKGIVMLDEWYYLDRPEPRLKSVSWMRYFPLLSKSTGIFHYRLGC
jgi:O-methyltransferase involved in polyketide biosynthesis